MCFPIYLFLFKLCILVGRGVFFLEKLIGRLYGTGESKSILFEGEGYFWREGCRVFVGFKTVSFDLC